MNIMDMVDKILGPCEFKPTCEYYRDESDICQRGGNWYCGQYRKRYEEKHK